MPALRMMVGAVRGEQYLTKTAQYGLVYNKGRSWADGFLVLRALANGRDLSRYGFSVGKRVGKAVVRNKTKRLLREILRMAPLQPGWDIVFIARSPAAQAGYAELEKSVKGLLSRAGLSAREHEEVCPCVN